MAVEQHSPLATFGRYEVCATLGSGGFATVYRAWDTSLQREVALKVLHPHLAEQTEFRERFLTEARAIAALDHPNIVTIYEVGEADGRPFLTMRLVAGATLSDVISAGAVLPLRRVIEIVYPLAAALDHLHKTGLVHRDIKPANVMVEPGGRVSLMDFGITRTAGRGMTSTGLILGTPEYIAPEQVQGRAVGPAADIYGLGTLTYHLLAGRPPFAGDTAALLFAAAYQQPHPLRELTPGLPESVYAAVDAALAKDPAARPATARAFAEGLAHAASAPLDATAEWALPNRPQAPVSPTRAPSRVGTPTHDVGAFVQTSMSGRPSSEPPTSDAWSMPAAVDVSVPCATRIRVQPRVLLGGVAGALAAGVLVLVIALSQRGDNAPPPADTEPTAAVQEGAVPVATVAATPPAVVAPPPITEATVQTVAGSGAGFADGPGMTARFNNPAGILVDRSGQLLVADMGNHRIRRIGADGAVSTLAGSGEAGSVDGPAATARFNSPIGIAQSPAGSIFVTDREGHRIRRVAADGAVQTFAGSGQAGRLDGQGTAARFNNPTGLAFDGIGNLYVSDFANHQIRRITPAGVVTTVAGSGDAGFLDGPGARARFNNPAGIAIDRAGYLYVADVSNHRIRKVAPDGTVSTVAGSGELGFGDGPAATAKFAAPTALTLDGEGNVYVVDYGNHRIRRISTTGTVGTVAGTGAQGFANGPGSSARFDTPIAIAMDLEGNLYVTEFGNRVRKIVLPKGN